MFKKYVLKLLPYTAGAIFILIGIGFWISSIQSMPGNATVLVNKTTKEYISPPCLEHKNYTDFLYAMTAEDAYKLGYQGERDCREYGGFVGESQSLIGKYIFPIPSRWSSDGSWRY